MIRLSAASKLFSRLRVLQPKQPICPAVETPILLVELHWANPQLIIDANYGRDLKFSIHSNHN